MFTIKIIVLVLATAGIATVLRASLLKPRSHGFYRFFAWETIIVLVVVNLHMWFRDPLSWYQVISWALLTGCLFPVILGIRLLKRVGRPDAQRDDTPMVGLEKTTELVTVGIYRYIRHPLYSSLLMLAWGVFFKRPSWVGGLLALVVVVFLVATAKVEEGENMRYYGSEYEVYMQRTKMFIPFVF